MQYTIRNIPEYLDAALREAARQRGKSLNEVAVQALVRGAGLSEGLSRKRDLGDVAGVWHEDASFATALAEQDTIDESIWPSRQDSRKRSRKKAVASTPGRPKRARMGASA
jgi:hypothetical protein